MDVTHLLQSYYNNFYPFDLIYNYLQKTPYREFTITLQNNVYIRALSFTSSDEMKNFVMKKIPAKIDVGPIYTTLPEQGTEMLPLKKELVFDIDLTDYKRNCCQGKTLCDLCFTLIKCAAKIMDFVLSEHFGFEKILYVFSGGRGLHIWVSDESAQYLDDYERKQISTYFQKLIKQKYVDETIISIIKEHSYYVKDQGMSCGTDIDTLIDLLYVKLDKNVTAEIKHLLKSPFSIHPTSYKISVPMSLDMLENLKVAEIPVLNDIFDNCERITKFLDYFKDFNSKEYKKY